MLYLGIDPGAKGGWALFDNEGLLKAGQLNLNKLEPFIWMVRRADVIGIERAQGAPGQAHQFEYGRGFGRLEGIIFALKGDINCLYYLAPAFWKARMGVSADKKKAVSKALDLLPSLHLYENRLGNVPDGVAEAALIGLAIQDQQLMADLAKNKEARVRRASLKKMIYR